MNFEAELTSRKVFRTLMFLILVLLVLHVSVYISRFYFGYDHLLGVVPLFNFGLERNVPTLFSTLLHLCAAACAFLIFLGETEANSTRRKYWLGLALIMAFLAVDETASIHEMSGVASREFFGGTGLLYYAWIIPWGAFALAVFCLYARFLLAIPRKIAFLFCLAGFVFLFGAVGLEAFQGRIAEAGGLMNADYLFLVTFEELAEMIGINILIYALINYMEVTGLCVGLRFGSSLDRTP